MFFLNLSLPEFLVLFSAVSGLVVALYLLDRSRKKQVVSTLRFWTNSSQPQQAQRRRKIQQPWSLLLQLLSLALLLLAIAQLRFGERDVQSRDHVVLLDTSAWMTARTPNGELQNEAKAKAQAYVRALPKSDRVMIMRVDGLSTPATGFEIDRGKLDQAIQSSQTSYTALDLQRAVRFAEQVQRLQGQRPGDIAYIGPGRVGGVAGASEESFPVNFRYLAVPGEVENCGIRKVGLRHSESDGDLWDVYVALRNYGGASRKVSVSLQFGGAPVGLRRVVLAPGADQDISFPLRTRAAGPLEVRILEPDAIATDNRAVLELPATKPLRIAVFSDQPDELRPMFAAKAQIQAEFFPASAYASAAKSEVTVFDRFVPSGELPPNSVLIMPPAKTSPIQVRDTVADVALTRWHSDHPLGAGLRTKQIRLSSAEILRPAPQDLVVAETAAGPVVVARPGNPRMVVLGFDPSGPGIRYELATPLLFANILRWMASDTFRRWELTANSVGSASVALDTVQDDNDIQVSTGDGHLLPYTVQAGTVRFFESSPGTVRIKSGDREVVYALSLPEIGEGIVTIPQSVRRGVPAQLPLPPVARDLWQMLALLGMGGLVLEWYLFGRRRNWAPASVAKLWKRPPLRRAS